MGLPDGAEHYGKSESFGKARNAINMKPYQWFVRPVLFRFDPEWVHQRTLAVCNKLGRNRLARSTVGALYRFENRRLQITIAGINFPSPVGLAAGFDKNGVAIELLAALGFGSVEIGSVSATASEGNRVRPRLFRLRSDEAMMVYYGVPNEGAAAVAARLVNFRRTVPLGVSLVETNAGIAADPRHVVAELASAARAFARDAEFLTINLHCPNMPGGTGHFAHPANLRLLLEGFGELGALPPVFLKITPPGDPAQIDAILQTCDPFPFIKGFTLNTHLENPRAGLKTPAAALEKMRGSVTGPINRQAVNDAIRNWYRRIDPQRFVLVGVGGIATAEHAYETIRLGASLVQVLTAMVYKGPDLIRDIKQGLCRLLERDGVSHIAEVVGIDNRPAQKEAFGIRGGKKCD
jgi:dihydroorotate dehydrogenase (fumarate)/dihydroorotate dehydrogenase